MLRNIIWDFDGTLFDTYPAMARAFKAALIDLGGDAALDWIEELARKSLDHCISTLAGQCSLNETELAEGFGRYYEQIGPEEQPPFPGVIAVCEYVCAQNGKNVIVTHRGPVGAERLLKANKMTGYFAGYLTGKDGYPKKPDPASFKAMLKMHNLRLEETLAVGDRDIDILAGRAAGVFTCLFAPEKKEELAADLLISHFDELLRFLLSNNKGSPAQE